MLTAGRPFYSVLLVAGFLGAMIYPLGAIAQTTCIIYENFNAGSLDTSVWDDASGSYPTVVPDDLQHVYALLFFSYAASQQVISTPYSLPAFGTDDVLALRIDVRRNHDSCWFGLYTAYDQPPSGGPYGSTPTLSAMWGIPFPDYSAGVADDPFYPTAAGDPQGFRIQVPSQPTTHPSSGSKDDYLAPYTLQVGRWYTLDLRYSSEEFSLLVDQSELLRLDASQLYYRFNQSDDWLFMLGDGGTNAYQPTNLSTDNILLIHTKAAVLAIMDAFVEESPYDPVSVERVDEWYNSFGPDVLLAALSESEGNHEQFLRLLNAYARRNDALPHLVLTEVHREDDIVTFVVENRGHAACCGAATLSAGLSYCTSWVPEWCTIFQDESFGEVCLLPGEKTVFQLDLAPVPEACRMAFAERLETLWTGYEDPDPQDYIGLLFSIGAEHCYGFLPDEV